MNKDPFPFVLALAGAALFAAGWYFGRHSATSAPGVAATNGLANEATRITTFEPKTNALPAPPPPDPETFSLTGTFSGNGKVIALFAGSSGSYDQAVGLGETYLSIFKLANVFEDHVVLIANPSPSGNGGGALNATNVLYVGSNHMEKSPGTGWVVKEGEAKTVEGATAIPSN